MYLKIMVIIVIFKQLKIVQMYLCNNSKIKTCPTSILQPQVLHCNNYGSQKKKYSQTGKHMCHKAWLPLFVCPSLFITLRGPIDVSVSSLQFKVLNNICCFTIQTLKKKILLLMQKSLTNGMQFWNRVYITSPLNATLGVFFESNYYQKSLCITI